LFETAAQEIENHLCCQLHDCPCKPLTTPRPWPRMFNNPANHCTRCFRCRQYGHIRTTCPHCH
jgi:hypothetical protein